MITCNDGTEDTTKEQMDEKLRSEQRFLFTMLAAMSHTDCKQSWNDIGNMATFQTVSGERFEVRVRKISK